MNRTLKQSLWLYFLTIIVGIITYTIRIVFARNLSLEEYGLFYAVYAFIFFFAPFRDLGLGEATIFFINKYLAKNDKQRMKGVMIVGLVPQLLLGFIITIILLILRHFIVYNYFKNESALYVYNILLILFAFQTILPTLKQLFSAYQKVIYFKIADVVKFSFILTISLLLFKYFTPNPKVTVPAYGYLFGDVATIVLFAILFYYHFKDIIKVKAIINKSLIKEMFGYALPIALSTAAGVFLTQMDIILLTYFKGAKLVGLYNIALPAITIITLLISPINLILFPKVSHLYHHKKKGTLVSILNFLYNNFLYLSLPLAVLFLAYPELIIKILFGSEYLGAVNTLRVFALFFVFRAIRDINFAIIAGIGKAKERSKVVYYAALFNFIADLVFIPLFAATGAAFATGLSWLLMAYLTTKIIIKEYKPKIDFKTQFKVILANFVFLISIALFKYIFHFSNLILEAILVVLISSLIYVSMLFVFKVLSRERIEFIKRLVFSN